MTGVGETGRMKILDLTAGNRAIWFNKNHPLATYLDKRKKVKPDIVCEINKLPKKVGSGYSLIVFDPPHMNCGKKSNMAKVYGHYTTAAIYTLILNAAESAHKIAKKNALLALKWNNHDIPLKKVFSLMPQWEPLFGHLTKDGPGSQTYWVMMRRI